MSFSLRQGLLWVVVAAAGCRGTVPEQVFTKPAPPEVPAAPSEPSGAWVPSPATSPSPYLIDHTAIVRVSADATTSREDSISSHLAARFVTEAGGRFRGHIAAFEVRGPGQPMGTPAGVVFPITFSGSITASGVVRSMEPDTLPECRSAVNAATLASRDLWMRLPDTLRIGTKWTDSTTATSCRDGVLLALTVSRAYRVTAAEGRGQDAVLLVSRTQRLRATGTGTQWGEAVRVEGAGDGEMALRLSASTGAVLDAVGRSTLTLSFVSARRRQRVDQATVTRIAAAK